MSFHTFIAVGNLGRDPEARYSPSGEMVCNFSIAINDNYTSKAGEKVERTMWVRVSTWGKLAENCNQYLKKGKKVLVEGHMLYDVKTGSPRIWERQDRTPAASFEVNAVTVRFLSARGEDEGSVGGEATSAPAEEEPATSEIPF